jgi:hypothetical protein
VGEWRYSSTYIDQGTRWEVRDQLHAPADAHWTGGFTAGLEGMEINLLFLTRMEPRTVQPVVRRYTDLDITAYLRPTWRKQNVRRQEYRGQNFLGQTNIDYTH